MSESRTLLYKFRKKAFLVRRRIFRYLYVLRDEHKAQEYLDRKSMQSHVDERDRALLSKDAPYLSELRKRYDNFSSPVTNHFHWAEGRIEFIEDNLPHFRGESPYIWHYREREDVTYLKYYAYLKYIESIDELGLLEKISEDGSFGAWTFEYVDKPRVSRDLLDSINEINFLSRMLGTSSFDKMRFLDIGAGYGRLASRMVSAATGISDYCCVDAVAESTFLCDFYLQYSGVARTARSLPLDKVEGSLLPDYFDVAVNIHSFSECKIEAIEWWVSLMASLRISRLLIIPNDEDELLSKESGSLRLDFSHLLEAFGYRLVHSEYVISDSAAREIFGVRDCFMWYELKYNV